MFHVRSLTRHIANFLKMFHALNISAVMPTEETAFFDFVNQEHHRASPQGILQRVKPTLQSILNILENITPLQRIALRANRIDDTPKFFTSQAMTCGSRISVARHFRRGRKTAHNIPSESFIHMLIIAHTAALVKPEPSIRQR